MQNSEKQIEFGRTGIILLFLPFIFGIIPGLIFIAPVIYLFNRELKKSGYHFRDLFGQDGSDNRKMFLKSIKERYNIKTYAYEEDSSKDKIDNNTEETTGTIEENNYIGGFFIKKIKTIGNIVVLSIFIFGIIDSGIIDLNRIKEKTPTNTSINIDNLFSGNSTRIRIILAILLIFITFKVVKALLDTKKQNKENPFKS